MTIDTSSLADVIRDCVQTYVNANQGSDEHPLGHAVVGDIRDFIPHLKEVQSVKGGFALRFADGTLYLVNVHQMPGTAPMDPAPQKPPGAGNVAG